MFCVLPFTSSLKKACPKNKERRVEVSTWRQTKHNEVDKMTHRNQLINSSNSTDSTKSHSDAECACGNRKRVRRRDTSKEKSKTDECRELDEEDGSR